MKAGVKIMMSMALVIICLVLLEVLYYITPEAHQLSGNLDKNSIATIIYLVCLVLMYKVFKNIWSITKRGILTFAIIFIIVLIMWPSYKSFPTNSLMTTNELYTLTTKFNINISNSEIYIYHSGIGWVNVNKIKYNELTHEENQNKRIVGIRLRNSNFLNTAKLNASGFYSIPIPVPIKEYKK